jgi:pimeloyl-ACP methyl ester carboxylesterase
MITLLTGFSRPVPKMHSVLPGESKEYLYKNHKIFYKVLGNPANPPLLFVHGIGAGASTFEWRHNFEVLSQDFQVFAYDLLGFGLSDRPDLEYSANLYIQLLSSFLKEVIQKPTYLLAASLSAGHALQAALQHPDLIKKLILIVPAGSNKITGKSGPNVTGTASYPVLKLPGLGKNLFGLFASKIGIRTFTENAMYYDRRFVTADLLDYYYISSHQPGAEHAPLAFFANRLNAEIGESFGKLIQPTLLFWGKEATVSPPEDGYVLLRQNPQAKMVILDKAKLACNEEQAQLFNRLALNFLQHPESKIELSGTGFKVARTGNG